MSEILVRWIMRTTDGTEQHHEQVVDSFKAAVLLKRATGGEIVLIEDDIHGQEINSETD